MFIKRLKNIAEAIPYPIGRILASVPFNIRLGRTYSGYKKLIKEVEQSELSTEKYIIDNFSKIFEYAKRNYTFYQNLYKENQVWDLKISSLADIEKVPVITKAMIRKHIKEFSGYFLLNTGGTSGEPFSFYADKNAFAREWAHMHTIWEMKGYTYKQLKLTLRGKNLGNKCIVYNPVHNEFIINTYKSIAEVKDEILKLLTDKKIHYIHGYPSTIFDFFRSLDEILGEKEKTIIRSNLQTCLFSSEFPHPNIINYLVGNWNLDYISWYGHSEMCILAYDEKKDNHYKPFPTYGYTEVIDNKLIGTSYHNFDMPLIRYDTGDIVEAEYKKNGIIENFSITQGRNADYITDKKGKNISLTALIFGRHHKAFDYVNFIQVQQSENKKIIFFLVTERKDLPPLQELLDLSHVDIDYEIRIVEKPFKTKAGKLKLKI